MYQNQYPPPAPSYPPPPPPPPPSSGYAPPPPPQQYSGYYYQQYDPAYQQQQGYYYQQGAWATPQEGDRHQTAYPPYSQQTPYPQPAPYTQQAPYSQQTSYPQQQIQYPPYSQAQSSDTTLPSQSTPSPSVSSEPPPPGTVDESEMKSAEATPQSGERTGEGVQSTSGEAQGVSQGTVQDSSQSASSQWTPQNQPQWGQPYQDYPGWQSQQAQGPWGQHQWSSPNQWGQWGGQGWQQQQQQQQGAQSWTSPGVEAWAGQPWSQQQGWGAGYGGSWQQGQSSWQGGEQSQGGKGYQAQQASYGTQAQQQGSYQWGSQPQPSLQQQEQHPQQQYGQQQGYGQSNDQGYSPTQPPLLPTPPVYNASPSGGRGRKRKRPSRWNTGEEQAPHPNRPYSAVPPPDQSYERKLLPPRPPPREDRTPPRPLPREDRMPTRYPPREDRTPPHPPPREDRTPPHPPPRDDRTSPRPPPRDDRTSPHPLPRKDRTPPRPPPRDDRTPTHPPPRDDRTPTHPLPREDRTPPLPPSPREDRTPTPPPPSQREKERSSPPGPSSWPPGLQVYITRSFQACSTDTQRDKVHEFLQGELQMIFQENRQWDIDWDSYPLPMDEDGGSLRKKKPSRWDTPSPSVELRGMPLQSARRTTPQREGWEEEGGMGAVVGKGKKKRKRKKGKNKFFLDAQPQEFVLSVEDQQRMSQRARRFSKGVEGNKNFKMKISINELVKPVGASGFGEEGEINWQDFAIEGTSSALEKMYLRLTSAPDPETVRPERVLHDSLEHVKRKWETGRDYRYACEQFKSIRQDLTIQGIRNQFTVEVYETHARVALENADRQEFNQCQTQLKALYSEGLSGHHAEFLAYKILYLLLTNNTADMSSVLKELTSDLYHTPCVAHALRLRTAWGLNNYHSFFRLYRTTPNMGGCLLDMFVERERKAALKAMAKAFRPSLKVSYISSELGFGSTEDCLAFLAAVGAVMDDKNLCVDCKLTVSKL